MKCVCKKKEPVSLQNYRETHPNGTWNELHDDKTAYKDCRTQLLTEQGGICAFCELDIRQNDPLKCRIEHFHPKSDKLTIHNWALDWNNMLGVCSGGSQKYLNAPDFLEPLSENLSCDAYKDKMIQSGKLKESCEGWIINPLELPAFPCLFTIEKSTGKLFPDKVQCALLKEWKNNQLSTVEALVQNTIDMLNLNCDRLCQTRLRVIRDIECNKKKQRDEGFTSAQGFSNLTKHYFKQRWAGFFTTIRICLGSAAETYLQSLHTQNPPAFP